MLPPATERSLRITWTATGTVTVAPAAAAFAARGWALTHLASGSRVCTIESSRGMAPFGADTMSP